MIMHIRLIVPILLLWSPLAMAEEFMPQDLSWFRDEPGQRQAVRTAADWDKRRADVLGRMQAVMGELPDRSKLPPLDLRVSETTQGDGYWRMTVSFANLYDERVKAYLYV